MSAHNRFVSLTISMICFLSLTVAVSCRANERVRFNIDTLGGALDGIRAGMDEKELLSLGYPSSRRVITMEGDEYSIIDVRLISDVVVECLIANNKVDRFSINSTKVRDENGVGKGTTLAELKRIYPEGKAIIGFEDVRYANFVNDSRVVFELDQSAIAPSCFDAEAVSCDLDPGIKVVKVVVHSGPAGVSNW